MNSKNNLKHNNPINILSKFVVQTSYKDLSEEAIRSAKTFILDSIGVGVAGSDGPWVENLINVIRGWGLGDGARTIVHGVSLPATSAAVINAYQIHCLEYDCVNEAAVLHPMATIMGAVLAEIDSGSNFSGKDLITAVAVGVDSSSVLGLSSNSPMRFFRPSTAGAFGATAAIAKLRKFDVNTLINAYGATYGQISGTLQPHLEGSAVLGMQIGFCARGALAACDLAQAGLEGPKDVISGMYGYLNLFEGDFDLGNHFENLGKIWQISRLSHKPFPSGRLTHGMVDGIQRLQKTKGLKHENVSKVRCYVPPLAHRLTGRPDIESPEPNYAKLCIPFVAATALIEGTVNVNHFKTEWLNNALVHEIAKNIQSIETDEKDPNVMAPQFLEVDLKNGETYREEIKSIYGHPDNPLSYQENIDKFLLAWSSSNKKLDKDKAFEVISLIDNLESSSNINKIIDLLIA